MPFFVGGGVAAVRAVGSSILPLVNAVFAVVVLTFSTLDRVPNKIEADAAFREMTDVVLGKHRTRNLPPHFIIFKTRIIRK